LRRLALNHGLLLLPSSLFLLLLLLLLLLLHGEYRSWVLRLFEPLQALQSCVFLSLPLLLHLMLFPGMPCFVLLFLFGLRSGLHSVSLLGCFALSLFLRLLLCFDLFYELEPLKAGLEACGTDLPLCYISFACSTSRCRWR